MASLPSVLVGNTLKLEPELRKQIPSLPIEKSSLNTSQLDKPLINLDVGEALSLIREGARIDSSICFPLLQECVEKSSVSEAQVIHGHIVKTRVHEDAFLMTFLFSVYTKCGSMENARKVFDKFSDRNVISWTSLMTGYVRSSQPELATRVFLEMLENGRYPTDYTLVGVLNACSLANTIELGKQIHAYAVKYQIEHDTRVGNTLCKLYTKCGSLESAIKAFRRVEKKNVICWTAVISSCRDNGDPAVGLSLLREMLSEGVEPNEYTLSSVFSLCSPKKALNIGLQAHSLSIKLGYELNLPTTNSILYYYLKGGFVHEAKKLLDKMQAVDLITWNAMIAGHAQMMDLAEDNLSAHDSGVEALKAFLELLRLGMKPDLFTFPSVLRACSGLVALQQGEQVHAHTVKTGFLSDVVVGTALVNMYNKGGSNERASKVFEEMPTRTLISWTAMITGFAQHAQSQLALQFFDDMRLTGVSPNVVTFVGVFSACSHAGMVDEALAYFEMMKHEYKIKPVMDHFGCLIGMFLRLGRLDEAFDFVKKMDFEPNEFIWSMLIASCRSHGNSELGFYAAEQLLKLKSRSYETYALLFNMYLSAGRWKDVSRVRKLMRRNKIEKPEDWSWITVKDKVYSFKPAGEFHPHCVDLDQLLGDLLEKAGALGYKSQGVLEVTDENEDEESTTFSTVHHSEKLAVTFGLLNTPDAAPIRVIKRMSMCQDCHSFIKLVSVVTAREIVVKDSRQLHKFVHGHCSCGDFGSLL